jgi:hypothetical protein
VVQNRPPFRLDLRRIYSGEIVYGYYINAMNYHLILDICKFKLFKIEY